MLDHPDIARVLDAGTTDSGRPYVAMELVRAFVVHSVPTIPVYLPRRGMVA
jgi:hypothetical protein